MARTIQAEYPTTHAGIERVVEGVSILRGLRATHVALAALATIGAPLTALAARARAAVRGWTAARRQRREDTKLWNVALSDARVMADLSRAMAAEAGMPRELRALS